jgi:hypothetical protein
MLAGEYTVTEHQFYFERMTYVLYQINYYDIHNMSSIVCSTKNPTVEDRKREHSHFPFSSDLSSLLLCGELVCVILVQY